MVQFTKNFKLRLANPRGAPNYIKVGHFGLWQLVSWEHSPNPSRLSNEVLEACTLTGSINSCYHFICLGEWTPLSRFGSACG